MGHADFLRERIDGESDSKPTQSPRLVKRPEPLIPAYLPVP